jgi:hypothetical protein
MCVLVGLVTFREKTVILCVASHLPVLVSGGHNGSCTGQTLAYVQSLAESETRGTRRNFE